MSGLIKKIYLLVCVFIFFLLLGAIIITERQLRLKQAGIFVQKPFKPANIIINVNKAFGPMPGVWRALAQGGEEPGKRMLKNTVSYVKALKPEYIRLDHIFDDDYYGVVRGKNSDGSLRLNWVKLDKTIKDIEVAGAKPFLSLTYMPKVLAKAKIDVPNWQDWQDLVRQTIKHYSNQYDDVYYEVWNEPSLASFGSWKMYGGKDYRLLYYYAVLGAKQAGAKYSFKIGGPAIPEMDSVWIKLLFDFCLKNNLPLDFISWHRYSFDPDDFVKDVYEVNVLLADPSYKKFGKIEKIITEWGPNSYKDIAYSSMVAASNTVAVMRKLLDKVKFAFAFEVKDGPGQGNYGWGLLSYSIKPKPRYRLFNWLADFNGQRLEVLGEGSNITGFAVKSSRQIKAILTNYNPYHPQAESFQTTFAGLAGGHYRLLVQELFGEPKEQKLDISPGSLIVNLNMPAYSVARIEITKISGLKQDKNLSGFSKINIDKNQF